MSLVEGRLVETIPEFGERIPGKVYSNRPGAYGVIFDPQGRVAVVRITMGFYLPGGGRNGEESAEGALRRETREECGLELACVHSLGEGVEFVYADRSNRYFRIHAAFFLAAPAGVSILPVETDHELLWMEAQYALNQLKRQRLSWALNRALQRSIYQEGG